MTVTEPNAAPASTQSDETAQGGTSAPEEQQSGHQAQPGTDGVGEPSSPSGSEGQNAGLIEAGAGTEGAAPDGATQGLREARDRYRGERDSAREQLATAQARIEAMQRAEIARIAGEHLAQGSDIFTMTDNDVSAYLTADGDVDTDRVAEDAQTLIGERPGLSKRRPMIDPFQGLGGSTPMPKRVPTLSDLLKS